MRLKLIMSKNRLPLLLAAIAILFAVLFYTLFIIPKNRREYINHRSQYFNRLEKNLSGKIIAATKSEYDGKTVKIDYSPSKLDETHGFDWDNINNRLIIYTEENAKNQNEESDQKEKKNRDFPESEVDPPHIGQRKTIILFDSILSLNHELFERYIIELQNDKDEYYTIYSEDPEIITDTIRKRIRRGLIFSEYGDYTNKKIVQAHVFTVKTPGLRNNMKFYVYGISNYENYITKLSDLSSKSVIYFMIGVLLLILINPLLKSVILGRFESLDVADVLKTSASFVVILQIIIMLGLSVFLFDIIRQSDSKLSLAKYSEEVLETTSSLIEKNVYYLENVNTKWDTLTALFSYPIVELKHNKNKIYFNIPEIDQAFDFFSENKALKIFWLRDSKDNAGKEEYKILFKDNNPTEQRKMLKERLNFRPYFRDLLDARKVFKLNLEKKEFDFYFQPLLSRLNSDLALTFSVKGKNGVLCVGSEADSFLFKPEKFGNGYEYCIINSDAEVLLHSIKQKSLNENLLEEFSEKKLLTAALSSNQIETFNTHYGTKNVIVNIRPFEYKLDGLRMPGYFLVTIKEDYDDAFFSQTINTAILTSSIFFLMLILIIFVLSMARAKSGVPFLSLKKFGWLYPDKNLTTKYALVFSANTIYFIILVLFAGFSSTRDTEVLENLYFISVYLYSSAFTTFIILSDKSKRQFFMHSLCIVFYISLVAMSMYFFRVLTVMGFCLPLLFFIIFIVYYYSQKHITKQSVVVKKTSEVLSLIVQNIFLRLIPKIDNSFQRSYCTFILSICVSWSIVPAIFIFESSYQQEKNKSFFYQYPEIKHKAGLKNDSAMSPYVNFVTKTRILNSQYAIDTRNLRSDVRIDSQNFDEILPTVHAPVFEKLLAFMFAMGILIVGTLLLFYIINYFVEKYFFIVVFENHKVQDLDTDILYKIIKNNIKHVFLTGPPHSGKTKQAERFLRKKIIHNEREIKGMNIDCITLMEADLTALIAEVKADKNFVIVDHFDYDILNAPLNEKKYALLTQLLSIQKIQLVVASTIHPGEFMDVYLKKSYSESSEFSQKYLLWNQLFINFYKLYFPLQGIERQKKQNSTSDATREFLEKECDHGYYLRDLIDPLEKFINPDPEKTAENNLKSLSGKDHKNTLTENQPLALKTLNIELYGDRETIINKIESMAYWYYLSLWNFLSDHEKFILIDLAQDGYVNLSNHNSLIILINKGIIVQEGGILKIFNESFSRFIINQSRNEKIQSDTSDTEYLQTWRSIRLPMSILLFAIVFFLLITQNEFYNSIIGHLTSALVGITLVFNLFRTLYPKTRNV